MRSIVAALVAVVCTWPSVSVAQPAPAAVSAWVAAPAAGATSAVAYVEVSNPTMYEIYITGATSDAAPTVELLAGKTGGAEPAVVTEFPVPAYGGTAAADTAPHLRLVGVSRPLAPGDTVLLTLTTDGGATLKVAAPVR
ncbi:MAG: copper chaperone PCu(A)C [Acidobacteria bacterium]|nr:copper chaperone PCu(A)C [Acidobacteriota bacterium]